MRPDRRISLCANWSPGVGVKIQSASLHIASARRNMSIDGHHSARGSFHGKESGPRAKVPARSVTNFTSQTATAAASQGITAAGGPCACTLGLRDECASALTGGSIKPSILLCFCHGLRQSVHVNEYVHSNFLMRHDRRATGTLWLCFWWTRARFSEQQRRERYAQLSSRLWRFGARGLSPWAARAATPLN